MKKILLLVIALFSQNLYAQTQDLQIMVGTGFHGTGDMRGYGFSVEYSKYFNSRLNYTLSIGSTIHDGESPLFYTDNQGQKVDASYRYTAAGFQAGYALGYNVLKSTSHELIFKINSIVRYQSSSYYDQLGTYYPENSRLPFPTYSIVNLTPQKTFAIGIGPQICYRFIFNQKNSIGIVGSYQFDTNGDNIAQTSLSFGRRF